MSKKKLQTELTGIEAPSIPEVTAAAEEYIAVRDERMKLTKKEVAAHTILLHEMRKAKIEKYSFNDQIAVIMPGKEKVKVKTVGNGEGEEEEAE